MFPNSDTSMLRFFCKLTNATASTTAPPPVIVIVGTSSYPYPPSSIVIAFTTPKIESILAVAVAAYAPGAPEVGGEISTLGIPV